MTEVSVPLVKGLQGDYIPASWPGHNPSGLIAYGKHLLVKVDPFSAVSALGIHFTDEDVDRKTSASTTGCIFDIGSSAFLHFDDMTPWKGPHPDLGDRVCFERHAGQLQMGADGCVYRFMDYRCICGGLDQAFIREQVAKGALEMAEVANG